MTYQASRRVSLEERYRIACSQNLKRPGKSFGMPCFKNCQWRLTWLFLGSKRSLRGPKAVRFRFVEEHRAAPFPRSSPVVTLVGGQLERLGGLSAALQSQTTILIGDFGSYQGNNPASAG